MPETVEGPSLRRIPSAPPVRRCLGRLQTTNSGAMSHRLSGGYRKTIYYLTS